jgi:DNA-binding MarR family transcriptional regulator
MVGLLGDLSMSRDIAQAAVSMSREISSCRDSGTLGVMARDHVDPLVEQWRTERPDLDPEHLAAMGTLNRLARFLAGTAAVLESELAPHGIKLGEFDVLSALRRSGPPYEQTPGQLISKLFLSSGAMTNRIDRLQTLGYVERHPHPEDGRGVIVRLTAAGLSVIDAAITTHVAAEHRMLDVLDQRQRRQLDAIVRTLLEPASRAPVA